MARGKNIRRDAARRTRPGIEGLESRRLMAVSFQVAEFPSTADAPTSIAYGPDGQYWFTLSASSAGPARIGSINPTTLATSFYPLFTPNATVGSIVSGPASDLWFTVVGNTSGAKYIAAFNPRTDGLAEFSVPNVSGISSLAAGPDGNLWFVDPGNFAVGVFDVATLQATEIFVNDLDTLSSIVAGPDGNLWFTDTHVPDFQYPNGVLGAINPTTHAITEINIGDFVTPSTITVGPDDDSLWWVQQVNSPVVSGTQLGEFNLATGAVTSHPGGDVGGLVAGPDGNVWYTGSGTLGMTVPATGATSSQAIPQAGTPAIATGPDGHLWLAGPGYIAEATILPASQAAVSGFVNVDPTATGGAGSGPAINQTVYLDLNGDGTLDPGDPTTSTDAIGYYTFAGLAPGTYTVRLAPYPGSVTTFPSGSGQTVTVAGGQLGTASNLGVAPFSTVLPVHLAANPFGTDNPDVQTAEVNGLYQILFGHAPDPTGLANSVAYLKGGGSLQTLTQILEHTTEYEGDVIASYYTNFLHRVGSPSEIAAWANLVQGGYTFEQVALLFVTSTEFNGLYPTDAAYIEALYEDFLGRQATPGEITAWESYLAGSNRAAMAHLFVSGAPTMNAAVVGLSTAFEGQPVDAATAAFDVYYLSNGLVSLADVATVLAGSPQFIQRATATVG
jgi:virginiamycin B lyase